MEIAHHFVAQFWHRTARTRHACCVEGGVRRRLRAWEEQAMALFDASTAQCLIYSFKDGLLSKIAHDLKHRATRFSIDVDEQFRAVRATIDARSLQVECVMKEGVETENGISDGDKRKIETQIVEDVLDANQHPSIDFRSTAIQPVAEGYRIEGLVRMHGIEKPIVSLAQRVNGHYSADLTLHQPDFGIKPFSAMLGTLKIKPDVIVRLMVPAI